MLTYGNPNSYPRMVALLIDKKVGQVTICQPGQTVYFETISQGNKIEVRTRRAPRPKKEKL